MGSMKVCLLSAFLLFAITIGDASQQQQWIQLDRAKDDEWVPIRVALKQRNLDILEATLVDTANPHSPNYGKWWTPSAILDLVAPPLAVSEHVARFLEAHGARNVENRHDMVMCEMQVGDIENVFNVHLNTFKNTFDSTKVLIRSREECVVPSEIEEHVHIIVGVNEFPFIKRKDLPQENVRKRDNADGYISINNLQQLYGVPVYFPVNETSAFAVGEFLGYGDYLPSDLVAFAQGMGIPLINVVEQIDNPADKGLMESSLDIQYAGGMACNTSIWFWAVDDWLYEFMTDLQNTTNPPQVISISYGYPEPLQCQLESPCTTSQVYVDRLNIEFQKVGLSGITLVAASGDDGASGPGNVYCQNATSGFNSTVPFSNNFPATSPYVLAVGATMLSNNSDVRFGSDQDPPICQKMECANSTYEVVCTYPHSTITSGGGFSNYFPTPNYQSSYVTSYLNSSVKLPPTEYFNSTNRGYPDVSALGHNFLVLMENQWQPVDGTSCATPVIAAIISLLNSYRLNQGKSTLGFINPLIYDAHSSDSSTFNDITSGNNYCGEVCCNNYGYFATEGWDPITGLGTPNFASLLNYIKNLP